MGTLTLLLAASVEPYSQVDLEARLAAQTISLLRQVPRAPVLSARLQRLLADQSRPLKAMDAEDLVDAVAKVIDQDDVDLQHELLAMTVTVARLGSVLLAMRLGRKVFEEMNTVED